MRISDWSSDVCSSDLASLFRFGTTIESTNVEATPTPPAARSGLPAFHVSRVRVRFGAEDKDGVERRCKAGQLSRARFIPRLAPFGADCFCINLQDNIAPSRRFMAHGPAPQTQW